ncbi:hypothetical protein Tco_1131945 [Tanacetum coccineum]|uniref:Uncharacterized protein n=1 Tax=Tanacetum coccineum TaxID=301880 RepID=A0ABQ5JAM0_9ASTR
MKSELEMRRRREKLLGLLHAPLGLNLGPRILSIIGSSIVTVGLECEHTDWQAGNPTSLEAVQSISKGDIFDADMDGDLGKTGHFWNLMPSKSDLVYPSLDDFVDVNESVSEFVVEKPTVETNEPETARNENRALIIEDLVSDSDKENMPKVKTVEMFNKPSFAKINFVKSTEQVKSPRKTSVDKNRQKIPSPRGNKRNWNQQMS